MKMIKMVCNNCGASLEVDESLDKITCEYCGTEIIIDDEASKLKRIEEAKLQARKENHEQDLKEEQDAYEKEKRVQEDKEIEADKQAFTKGKKGIFLIVFFVISLISLFNVGGIFAKFLVLVQACLIASAWLMGVHYIKEPKKGMRLLAIILALVLIVPIAYASGAPQKKKIEEEVSKVQEAQANIEQYNNGEESEATQQSEQKQETNDNATGIRSDFKNAMDSYESFMNEYVEFMKKYNNSNGSDIGLLADYATYMNKYSKVVEDFEKWDDSDLNDEEMAYYIEVQTRVNEKLLSVIE